MTDSPDIDTLRAARGPQPALPFAEDELATNGPRLRPAELARLLGVSRQSVSEWIKAGKIKPGSDGRLDPRKAVADVLKAGDPARLRVRVLAPFAAEIAALRARVAQLTHQLATCEEDRQFHEGASGELAAQVNKLESLVCSLPGIDGPARAALLAAINAYTGDGSHDLGAGELPPLTEAELDCLGDTVEAPNRDDLGVEELPPLTEAELDCLDEMVEAPKPASPWQG